MMRAQRAERSSREPRAWRDLLEFMCDPLLNRFRRPGGIAALGNFMAKSGRIAMLLSSESCVHKPDCRASAVELRKRRTTPSSNFLCTSKCSSAKTRERRDSASRRIQSCRPRVAGSVEGRPQTKNGGHCGELERLARR